MKSLVFLLAAQLSVLTLQGAATPDDLRTPAQGSNSAVANPVLTPEPAKSGTTGNPQADLKTAILDIARLIRTGDLVVYRNTYATPEALKQMKPLRFWSGNFDHAEQQFAQNPIMINDPALKQTAMQGLQQQREAMDKEAKAWEALAGQTPVYNQAGDEATYTKAKMSAQPPWVWDEKETIVLVKINGLWYLKDFALPNVSLTASRTAIPKLTPSSGPGKSGTTANPQADLNPAILDIAHLISLGDIMNYRKTYTTPDALKQNPVRTSRNLEQMAQLASAQDPQIQRVLQLTRQICEGEAKAWEALADQTPAYNQAGDEATYTKVKASDHAPVVWDQKETVIFVKINGFWYLKDVILPNVNVIEKIQ